MKDPKRFGMIHCKKDWSLDKTGTADSRNLYVGVALPSKALWFVKNPIGQCSS